MHVALSVAVVIVYAMLLVFVAARARTAREYEDFSVAKRELPLALIFGSIAATYVGPGFSIGFAGKGFRIGFLFLIPGLAYAIQNILVGLLVAPRLRELKGCYTLGDAIGQKYGKRCQILAGVVSIVVCTLLSAVMVKAGGVVLNDILEVPRWLSICLIAVVTASYTTFGGLRASVITDAFHFALFTVLLPVILVYVLLFRIDGAAASFSQEAVAATVEGFRSTRPIELISFVTAFLLGEMLIPPYANLALASRTTRVSRNGFVVAGVFAVVWFTVMISLGVMARTTLAEDTVEDYVLLNLARAVMPNAGFALLLVALVSIVLSSFDSLLNAGAVVFTQDIIRQFAKLPDAVALTAGRYSTILIAVVAAAGAVAVPNIIDGLLKCYTIWAPAILPAAVLGLWLREPRPLAGFLSMTVGAAVAVLFLLVQWAWPDAVRIPPILPALGVSLAAYLFGHLFGRHRGGRP